MSQHSPSNLTASYPTTASLIALYSSEGLSTGFGYYTAGNPVFADSTAFFNKLAAEGFFTGGSPRLYYTPAQAASLLSRGTVVYNSRTINLIEYRLRIEGLTTGDIRSVGVVHAPGEDQCTILAALEAEGYTTGDASIAPSTSNPALSDLTCADGRLYQTECVALWSAYRAVGSQDAAWDSGLVENVSHRIVKTFAAPVTLMIGIWWMGGAGGPTTDVGLTIDDVKIIWSEHDTTGAKVMLYNLSAGTHTFKFYYMTYGARPGRFSIIAFRQGG